MRSVGKKVFRTGFLAGMVMFLMTLMGGVVHAEAATQVGSWHELYNALHNGGNFILSKNVVRGDGENPLLNSGKDLFVGSGKTVSLDLNGYYINNGGNNSSVIRLADSSGCKLTIKDGKPNDSVHYVTMGNWSVTEISDSKPENMKEFDNVSGTGTIMVSGGLITGGSVYDGGGIQVGRNCQLIMEGGTIAGNSASTGGGVYDAGTFKMDESAKIEYNYADGNGGGGVNIVSGGTLIMEKSATIAYNTTNGDGGGVNIYEATLEMNGSTSISGNKAVNGGGVYVASGYSFTMEDTAEISNNTSKEKGGGGVYLDYSSMTMKGSAKITDNDGGDLGGGVFMNAGSLEMTGSASISGNKAGNGGGVYGYKDGENGSTILIKENAEVLSNTANSDGGIFIDGEISMTGGRISKNKATGINPQAGGVCAYGKFTMSGGVISGNESIATMTARGGGVYFSSGYSTTAEFTMSGNARISDNSVSGDGDGQGGGVYISDGTLTMSGGVITGNTANGKKSGSGGGVYIYDKGLFEMKENAIISENNAISGGGIYIFMGETAINGGSIIFNNATSGGGLYNFIGNVRINGGKITQNKAENGGGAFTLCYEVDKVFGSYTVSGNGEISGNTKSDGKTADNLCLLKPAETIKLGDLDLTTDMARMPVLTVAGELTGKVGLTMDPLEPGTVVARGSDEGGNVYSITEKDVANLISDDEKYAIGYEPNDKTALLLKSFTVKMAEEVTYTGNPFLPEVTSYDGTALVKDKDYTLTINGDNVNYTGNPVTITVTGMGDYAGTHTVTFTIKAPEPKPDTDPGNEPQTEPQPEPIMVSSVKLSKTKVTIGKNQTFSLYATVNPADADNKKVAWKSSNSKVVTVNSSGKIKGVKAGSATITATAADGSGKKATCKVTVRKEKIVLVNSIKLDKKSNTISPKESFTLKATVKPTNAKDKNVTWISSDTKVAKVSSKGKVTGVGAGKATITAIAGDKKATCTVSVIKVVKVKGIILNKSKASLKKGKTLTLKATVLPKDATNKTITWTSSNTKVATVDPKSGKITAKSSGNATITAKAKDGSKIKATCKVTVN